MIKKISPSVMCIDYLKIEQTLKEFEECGIDLIHIDIMDGSFVQNYTLGTDFVKFIKNHTDIPVDIHLMIDEPERKLEWFEFGENDYVSVHYEATKHLHRAVSAIKKRGAKAMVAINPATPVNVLEDVIEDIDAVLIMTVNPGFAGQKLVNSTLNKIKKIKDAYPEIEIEVDGNVSFENAKLMSEAGANIFVAGTSSVFSKNDTISSNIKKIKSMIC